MLSARRLLSRLPVLGMDAAMAAAVGLVTAFMDGLGADYRSNGAPLWDIALAAPLVLRRRMPATAAAALGLICLAQWIAGPLADGDVAVLVMLYSLGVHERRRWVLPAAVAVAELGVVMAVTRFGPPSARWQSGLLISGTVTASWLLGRYVRTHRDYVDAVVARAEAAERDRDTQAEIAVEAERARMAREMHDIIAHSLSVMITLNDAAAAVPDPQAAQQAAGQAADVGREALGEMQRLLGVLRAGGPVDLSPQPGVAQLPDLVALVRAAGLQVRFTVSGELTGLAATTELALYRIVQESLTNILKHARNVTHVTVDVSHVDGTINVSVRNDGDDAEPAGRSPRGRGLMGMHERVALYGGHLHADPAPGGGWLVTADLATARAAGLAEQR